ncbi:hypothetical protein LZ31DRAFT_158445 [Colletotrichum somersetense]|nr:hypothetical protein LZ31DRAFT_158445 [Colletotrichum somersetense]
MQFPPRARLAWDSYDRREDHVVSWRCGGGTPTQNADRLSTLTHLPPHPTRTLPRPHFTSTSILALSLHLTYLTSFHIPSRPPISLHHKLPSPPHISHPHALSTSSRHRSIPQPASQISSPSPLRSQPFAPANRLGEIKQTQPTTLTSTTASLHKDRGGRQRKRFTIPQGGATRSAFFLRHPLNEES